MFLLRSAFKTSSIVYRHRDFAAAKAQHFNRVTVSWGHSGHVFPILEVI